MTDFIFYFLAAAISSILTNLYLWRSRQWTDNEYYALVQKYSDAAYALPSMKAELDKLQEQLEFSEDVRYTLRMENARLAKEIEGLKRDVERGEEARFFLMGQLNIVINDKWRLEDRLKVAERSLRIARHKEFKAWKKRMKAKVSHDPATYAYHPSPADEFSTNEYIRLYAPSHAKQLIRESIDRLKRMDPYPLP